MPLSDRIIAALGNVILKRMSTHFSPFGNIGMGIDVVQCPFCGQIGEKIVVSLDKDKFAYHCENCGKLNFSVEDV